METLSSYAQPFFESLLRSTVQAGIAICLIFLIQAILRNRLSARWHYALWLILVARMVLPWAPQSRFSIYNLATRQTGSAGPAQVTLEQNTEPAQTAAEPSATPQTTAAPQTADTMEGQGTSSPASMGTSHVSPDAATHTAFELAKLLPFVWLAGALSLGGYIVFCNLRLWRAARLECPSTDKETLELLEECRAVIGLRTIVALVPSEKVNTPILLGFVRPRLLLPKNIREKLSREELRYVFLHELAHVKRHDIALGWLTALLQVLHWLNPLVWLAFHRMRSNRESACDALVLSRMRGEDMENYGLAIVSLLEYLAAPQPLPGLAGILESKSQVKRRIAMITKFKHSSYRWSPLALIVIIILACVSLPDAMRTQASETSAAKAAPALVVRRVWAEAADSDFMGTPSPDGKYLSYVDWETGDLAVHDLATGTNRKLTNEGWDKGWAQHSVFSPDGQKIVYDWCNKESFIELRIVGLDGSEPRILYRNKEVGWAHTYDWSPDGKQILACFSKKGSDQIVLASVMDGSVRVLKTLNKGYPKNMAISPDGRYIVYDFPQKEKSLESDIFLLAVDGSNETALVEHPADDFVLGWAPDGKRIVFASDRTGNMGIWAIEVADGKPHGTPHLLKPDVGLFHPMGFTLNGSYYYGVASGGNNIYVATYDPQKGNVTGEPVLAIKRYEGSNWAPDWSPDGRYLACVSERPGAGRVFLIQSVETGEVRELSSDIEKFDDHSLRWSPDGRSLLGTGRTKDFPPGRMGILRIDVETGKVTTVFRGGQFPNVTSDGKTMFHVSRGHNGWWIFHHDLTTGDRYPMFRAKVGEHVGAICGLVLSPDEKYLAFQDLDAGMLKVLPVAPGQVRELVKFDAFATIAWTPDGNDLLYAKQLSKSPSQLWRISAEGGEPQKLDLTMPLEHIRFHPDGRRIAFTGKDGTARIEVWVMENFLPGATAPVAKPARRPDFRKIHIATQPGSGVLSPDGGKLAFVSDGSVWVVPVHGKVSPDIAGEPVRLTERMGAWDVASTLAWSADGKWIAFNVSGEEEYDAIYIISSSGGTPRRVPVEPRRRSVQSYRLSLSPDGKVVAFCSRYIGGSEAESSKEPREFRPSVGGSFIYTVPVAGGNVKRLTDTWSGEQTFSPDGKKIAFVKYDTFKRGELCVIPAVGGNPIQVSDSNPNRAVRGPVWSPDGKMIAFIAQTASGRNEVCIIPVPDTGKTSAKPTKVQLPLDSYDVLAGWTPDDKIGMFLHNPDPWAIHTVPASGGQAVQVTPSGWATHPQWSPDGQRIYFRWDEGEMASVPSAGGQLSIGPFHKDETFCLAYPGSGNAVSPDGKQIVFSDGIRIYTVPVEGGESKEVAQGRYPCWSPDGKSIAFIRTDQRPVRTESGWNIYVVSSKGGDVRQVTFEPDNIRRTHIDWSPDGTSIAYFAKDRTIKAVPVQGGESKIVAKAGELRNHDELAWSPDGSKLVYSSEGSIWMVSSDGGQPRKVRTGLDADAGHVSWSPDGKKLAFVAIMGGAEDLYLMEDFLPKAVAAARE